MRETGFRRNIAVFASGMLAMAMLVTLAEPVSAAGEKFACNQVGIRVMRKQQVNAGEAYTAPNGQEIPSTITYTDAAGGTSNYISVRQLSELIDADISWDAKTNSVDIGVSPIPSEVIVTAGVGPADQKPASPPAGAPEYGLRIGSLEEIDPATVKDVVAMDPHTYPGGIMYAYHTRVQYGYGGCPDISASPLFANGEYLVYTVTNNSELPQGVTVSRRITVSLGRWEKFPTLYVEPGETLVRVFRVLEESHPMRRTFDFGVIGAAGGRDSGDVTVSLVQYRG